MLTLIAIVTFVVVPSICILSIGCWDGLGRIELPEPTYIAWHEEVDSINFISSAPKNEETPLDSIQLLLEEMEDFGVELAFISCLPGSGDPLVVLEDDSMDVDVSEFSDAYNPAVAPAMMILSINDEEVEAAAVRDGLYFGETVIEMPEESTQIILEADDGDIRGMVADIMGDYSWMDAGSDESTFFEPTAWDDNFKYSDTIVDWRFEC